MPSVHDICSLEYLIGTLSTAYKGVITSLVVKDFCMTEADGSVTLHGTILSIPPGNYEACLIQKGVELARNVLDTGHFELKGQAERIKAIKDLQIDVVQAGRHIGTFLLQKGTRGGFFESAIELSSELKGLDFKLLTEPVRNQIGLLRKAEEVITKILSTKKDWAAFSEQLNSFAQDFFWSARSSFYEAFGLLSQFLRKAAQTSDTQTAAKPIANFLALIELPLDHETDDTKVLRAAGIWLKEQKRSPLDLSPHVWTAADIFQKIHERFPTAEVAPILAKLVDAVRSRIASLPVVATRLLDPIRASHPEVYGTLARYSSEARSAHLEKLTDRSNELERGTIADIFSTLKEITPDLIDDARMIKGIFGTVVNNINPQSAGAEVKVLAELLAEAPVLSPAAVGSIKADLPRIMEKLTSFERFDLCFLLFDALLRLTAPHKDEILMNPLVAAAVLRSGNNRMVNRYIEQLNEIVIPAPGVKEISTETWAEVANPLHLDRVARFLDVLQMGDGRLRPVLAHVIANLSIVGLFIPDDRLFQRRISSYLNSSAMEGDFVLNFLLLDKLPAYYNEVGAVSRIRDLSTEIDAWGNDPVLYFVRKQVHVNASNYNITLLERVIRSWTANDSRMLEGAVPADVLEGIKPELFERYSRFITPFLTFHGVLIEKEPDFEKLRRVPAKEFAVRSRNGQLDEIPTKVMLFCRLYQEIVKKYSRKINIREAQEGAASTLSEYVERMRELIQIIRAPEKTIAAESLYFKRHIAFGIPSVLGTYHEPKFDAFADFLRLGGEVRPLLEQIAAEIEMKGSNADYIGAWFHTLAHCWELLKLHGFQNPRIDELIQTFKHNRLHLSQVADLLKIWQKELAWIVASLGRTFQEPIVNILRSLSSDDLPEHLMRLDLSKTEYANRAGDVVIRDILATVPGLMESDRIGERLQHKTMRVRETDDDLIINTGVPTEGRPWFDLFELSDKEAMSYAPLLGDKAKNLAYLHNKKFEVPAGAVLPPGPSRESPGKGFAELIKECVGRIESRTGRMFGGSVKPLFLSVRSGSYISMPGILATILYCGMNRQTADALSKELRDARVGLDSYSRFVEQYATAVFGIENHVFEEMRRAVMMKKGSFEPERLSADDLNELITGYHAALKKRGFFIPEDVYEQLHLAIEAVAGSWTSTRAVQFRRAMKTSEHWGTSVLLMQMITANAQGSGSSVFFTRNPFTYERGVFGETRTKATGDELVLGRGLNQPLSKNQTAPWQRIGGHGAESSLEETDPELYALHEQFAAGIEAAMGGLPQEVEIAYTRDVDGIRKVFVLQTRRMEFSAGVVRRFDEVCGMEGRVVGRGIGAHGGAISGVASFAERPEQVAQLVRKSTMPIILFRTTANTDDVAFMPAISGIVTSVGGVTSHAAVLAQKFGIIAVVACSDLVIQRNSRGEFFANIGGQELQEGSLVSIDGSTGLVFSGTCFSVSNVGL